MRHSWTISLALLAIAGLGILGAGPGAERYIITDLGTLEGKIHSAAYGINAGGQVVGAAHDWDGPDYDGLAFLWDPTSGIQSLPLLDPDPNYARSAAYRINDAGWIVGEADGGDEDGYVHAVIWHDGGITNLGTLRNCDPNDPNDPNGCDDHNHSRGRGVNNLGQAVGWSWWASTRAGIGPPNAFLWDDGVMIGLGTLEPNDGASQAFGINDYTQVVGVSSTSSLEWHAFLWENDGMVDLGTLGGDSEAYDINNSGDVVGWSNWHACAWIDGALIDLGPGTAYAINDLAQIVGADPGRAVLWEETTLGQWESVDLNDRLPCGSAWTLFTARDINDRGQIVGRGMNPSTYTHHGYLLTPTFLGDIDLDCDVDLADLATLLACYGCCEPDPCYDGCASADLNCDGDVDLSDLAALLAEFGAECP